MIAGADAADSTRANAAAAEAAPRFIAAQNTTAARCYTGSMTSARRIADLGATLLLVACGDPSAEREAASACAGYAAQASAAEIDATPRANETAEILALEATSTLVAAQALYERIEADLIVIQQLGFTAYTPLSEAPIDDLRISFDAEGWARAVAGQPLAWDCPNQAYGATVTLNEQWQFASVKFGEKRYRGALLAQEYGLLPHVTSSSRDSYFQDGPDSCLEQRGAQHFYVFDDARGDCPAGCMEHRYAGYESSPDGTVTKLGTFEQGKDPEPAWFAELLDCRSRL